jgi:HK97 family phage prohead protease
VTDLSMRAELAECARWMHRKAPEGANPPREFRTQFEIRGKANGKAKVFGYASTTGPDNAYTMRDAFGEYTEEVAPGAFTKTLAESPKVQLLLNHGGLAMAYTRSGSLALGEDSTGFEYEGTVNLARSDVNDAVIAVEDGDVSESSFAFRVVKQSWSPDYDYRKITEVSMDRGDVSIVNFGANPNTPVSVERALQMSEVLAFARTLSDEQRVELAASLAPADPELAAVVTPSNAAARIRIAATRI